MASTEAVQRRREFRRLRRSVKFGPVVQDPVTIKLVMEHNRAMRERAGLGEHIQRRIDRLYRVFDRWRHSQIQKMVVAGELRYVAFSFTLWMMEERCGWSEKKIEENLCMPPGARGALIVQMEHERIWRWWNRDLHIINQLEIVRSRRDYR